jgi:beta-glucosidase/6-phospho-beta-glucosidase/beta-galactosidase
MSTPAPHHPSVSRRQLLTGAGLGAAALAVGALGTAKAPAAPADSSFASPTPVAGWTEGFHFGAASSGFQCEGFNPDSNWRRYTDRAAKAGTVDPVRNAADFRHRYAEDLELAKGMGLNTFRIGIEWARVEPRRGHHDPAALAYYDSVIATIRSLGMSPMITLVHYVYPGWVADQGGFLAAATLRDFERYARMITARYADACTMWISFNEPLVFYGHETEIGAITTADLPLPVVGYNHWAITDNYEWGTYDSRFGLYQVDVLTDPSLTRKPTTGVDAYREMTAQSGPRAGYRPVMAPATGSFARIPQSWTSPSVVAGPRARLA